MRYLILACLLAASAITLAFAFPGSRSQTEAGAQTIVVTAIADAYVSSGEPFTNFGADDDLRLGRAQTEIGPVEQHIYLRFPPVTLPEGTQPSKVRLQLYQDAILDSSIDIQVHPASGPWEENQITWANRPGGVGMAVVGNWSKEPGWKERDLLISGQYNFMNWPFEEDNFGLIVYLRSTTSILDAPYRSRNDVRFAPRLIVETEPVPTATPTPTPWPTPTPIGEIAPGAVNLKVDAIEVTQGIQDLKNSVRLVRDKRTFVRLHVSSNKKSHWTYAYLKVRRGSQERFVYPLNGFFGHIPVPPNPDRANLDDAFLFELPAGFRQGTVTITAYLNPDTDWRDPNPAEYDYSDNVKSVTVQFETTPPLNLAIYRVHYYVNGELRFTPLYHATLMTSWLRRAYPVSQVNSWDRSMFWASPTETLSCDAVNATLTALRQISLLTNTFPSNTVFYGMVVEDGFFMVGCSPGKGPWVASGPAGDPKSTGRFTWDDDSSYGDWYGGHELGHTFGRGHAAFCGAQGGPPYPYPDGRISPTTEGEDALYGFDILTRAIYPPTWKDVMSYCSSQWLSDFTYEGLMDELQSLQTTQASSAPAANPNAPAQTGRYQGLMVIGSIDPTTGQTDLIPPMVLPSRVQPTPPARGSYTIVLRGARGELARYPFQPTLIEEGPHFQTDPGVDRSVSVLAINEFVPYPAGATQMDILDPDGALLTSIRPGPGAPSVTITSPNGGEIVSGATLPITWKAQDPDDDPLTFTVQYSTDGGFTWETLATSLTDPQLTLPAENLPGGSTQALIRVWATDGINTAMDESDGPFTVPNHPPTLNILSPEPAIQAVVHQTLNLEAQAYDVELGSAIGASIQWSSDLEGILGMGEQLSVALSTPGLHTITAYVEDGQGGMATDAVQITVLATPPPPPASFLPLVVR